MNTRSLLIALVWVLTATHGLGQGHLVPRDSALSPLQMKSQRVEATIRDQVAATRVTQVFLNSSARPIEADFVFPLPRSANFTEFVMMMDGKRVKGEMMQAGRARAIYEDIVRRARDPGLIEFVDRDLFRARVFPVPANGEQLIEIAYSQVIQTEDGVSSYQYPFRGANDMDRTADTSLVLHLESEQEIKSILSPTHNVLVVRTNDHAAEISFETTVAEELRNFEVYYATGAGDIGVNLVAHRAADDNGYFLLLLAPRVSLPSSAVQPKDVCFVLDSSGSMRGEKLAQAKAALLECIGSLNEGDRFAVLHFNTAVYSQRASRRVQDDVEALLTQAIRPGIAPMPAKLPITFLDAGPAAAGIAGAFIAAIEAGGGTALAGALEMALCGHPEGDRPYHVFFLTDGQPTVGQAQPNAILAMLEAQNTSKTRVYVFGVGYDVNTRLLDAIAERTAADCTYVHPGESITTKVTGLYRKVGAPLLTDISLDVSGAGVCELYPKRLPDLGVGSQIEVFGRYADPGRSHVVLQANLAGEHRTLEYDLVFPETADHEFVPALWARRKVGYMMDNIRANGASDELVDEVVALGTQYNIVTPYTSLIALDPGERERALRINPGSAIAFNFPEIRDSRIVEQVSRVQYLADPKRIIAAAGKMGAGGAGPGGWPEGMQDRKVRFIRLQYDGAGWDDGMDSVSRADMNFLEYFKKLTGFNVSSRGESHAMALLAKYPKGCAPPLVYLTGSGDIGASEPDVRALRDYLLGGGMLFADCGSPQWDRSFRAFLARVLPGQALRAIADDDVLFQTPFAFLNGPPPLWHHGGTQAMGVKHNGRWIVFYHPGDVNDAWKTGRSGMGEEQAAGAMELGVNLVYYAFTQAQGLVRGAGAVAPAAAPTAGEQAVRLSESMTARKQQSTLESSTLRKASGRIFAKTGDTWVDQAWTGAPAPIPIRFGSAAFFALLARNPALNGALSVGDDVLIVIDAQTVLRIGDNGKDTLTEDELLRFGGAAKRP